MLLLDEPLAGMGSNESRRMVAMLQDLKRRLTILLVEHDLEAVFELADQITRNRRPDPDLFILSAGSDELAVR